MDELSDGLGDANDGVGEISDGLVDASDYLEGLNGSSVSHSTFYIPEDEIYGDEFPRSMNIFFSEDKQITQFILVLDVDPYSLEGMEVVRNINAIFNAALQTTSLRDAKWGVSGITQMNLDLQSMSNADFALARVIMLAGIFVVMLFITRDFWMTLFVSMSLVASYFIALTVAGLAFNQILAVPQLSWNVPFFSFIMIVTLGVDYSIFLIMRQKENTGMPATESVVEAAARVGSVIVSAGLILSGTFAAMLPSGVLTLMEVAVTVIIGILLLCLLFIPIFIPCMISFQHKLTGFQQSEGKPVLNFRPRHSN
jgi:putative drug exporter of the RND superfamily